MKFHKNNRTRLVVVKETRVFTRMQVVGEGEKDGEEERGEKVKRRDVLTHMMSCACNTRLICAFLEITN